MKKVLLASLALLLLAFFALPAMATFSSATLVTPSGSHYNINGLYYSDSTPVRLFEPASNDPYGLPPQDTPPDIWWYNNRSTVNDGLGGYPDYVPSPGYSAAGESFDIEGVFWQYSSGTLNVWVVTSVGPDGTAYGGNRYHLGDVFLNSDSDAAYDYALLSFDVQPGLPADNTVWTIPYPSGSPTDTWDGTGRDAGALVTLTSPDYYGINGPNSYQGYSGVEDDTNPWALENPGTTSGTLKYDYVNTALVNSLDGPYATGVGAGTYVYLWTVSLALDTDMIKYLSIPGAFHVSVQCGNDEGGNPDGQGGGQIPAPGALILGIIGAGLVGLRRRMKA